MARVTVDPSVLRWAIERSGVSRTELRRRFPKLNAWEQRQIQPTMPQLEAFAKATSTPFGYLFLPQPPHEELPIPHFRTVNDQPHARPSPELLDTVHLMERRQGWMREYLIEQGQRRLLFVGSAVLTDRPNAVALGMKQVLGLSNGWAAQRRTWTDALRDLRAAVEAVGIIVVVNSIVGNNTHRKLNVEEFRGFVLVDEFAPLVFTNGADAKAAQMFTLAHELAHIWLGVSAAFDLRKLQPANDQTERVCNEVAAEFLVPESELRHAWGTVDRESDPFEAIARRFKVSQIVAARRALDLNLITVNRFSQFWEQYENDERRTAEQDQSGGGDFYASQNYRISRRFGEAVIRAVKEGRLLYHEAYQLTGISGTTFDRYAKLLDVDAGRSR